MTIKREKMSDGFFVWESVSLEIGPGIENTNEDLEVLMSEWDFPANKALANIEKRIQHLHETQEGKAGRQSPELQKNLDEYKTLDHVKSYASQALKCLKTVRTSLQEGNTEDAVINTINMMDAYWHGYIHSDKIKLKVLRDKYQTIGRQEGGTNRSDQYRECRSRLPQLAAEVWRKQKNPKPVSWMIEYLLKHEPEACKNTDGKTIGKTTIGNYIKEFRPKPK